MALDTRGQLYDGTPLATPADLRQALLRMPEALLRNFTTNLLAYSLGRRVESQDMPAVRAIVREAAEQDGRMSAFILGVVQSEQFQRATAEVTTAATDDQATGGGR
jgi:hypothetical protein